ncbi:hypothetical protein M0R45_010682 [Rubus argutus]|uniref:Uncharacterized protein n=1 Tax=Rubus argutus TaxID=59490 RepID=A0AAW1Y840_RUBAR
MVKFLNMVLVATLVVFLMNVDSNEACRVLNKDVLQKGTVSAPHLPLIIKQIVQSTNEGTKIPSTSTLGLHYVSDGGIYISSIIRQRLEKGPVPPSGNPTTNNPAPHHPIP